MLEQRSYNAYGPWLRKEHGGKKVYKVIVDAGFTCPNRDGSKGFGGCAYCNVDSFTPELSRSTPGIANQVEAGIAFARKQYGFEKFIVYFQPNTNTYAQVETLKAYFDEALSVPDPDIIGLSVGTRPDCLDEEKVQLLESYADRGYLVDVEIGMESMYDKTLLALNRGHLHYHFEDAMKLVANRKFKVCVHTVFGFPGETREMMLKVAEELNRHPIHFVKLHHLHIVKGSIYGVRYQRDPSLFDLFSLESYTEFLADFLPRLRSDLVVQRLFGLADKDTLIAPIWNKRKQEVQLYIDNYLQEKGVVQGSEAMHPAVG